MIYFWKEHKYKPHVKGNDIELYLTSVFSEAGT